MPRCTNTARRLQTVKRPGVPQSGLESWTGRSASPMPCPTIQRRQLHATEPEVSDPEQTLTSPPPGFQASTSTTTTMTRRRPACRSSVCGRCTRHKLQNSRVRPLSADRAHGAALAASRRVARTAHGHARPEILSGAGTHSVIPITSLHRSRARGRWGLLEMWVDVSVRDYPDDLGTPPWEEVRARASRIRPDDRPHSADLEAMRYLFELARAETGASSRRERWRAFRWTARSWRACALMNRIHEELTFVLGHDHYRPGDDRLRAEARRLCQDFAHHAELPARHQLAARCS